MTPNPSKVAKVDANFRQRLFADIDWIQDMFREGIEPDADALDATLKRLRQAIPLLDRRATDEGEAKTLDRDQATLALWQAISAITYGNKTDDKLILDELYKRGFWICAIGGSNKTPRSAAPDGERHEIRNNPDGTLDEVVGSGDFHLEQMNFNQWFLLLERVHITISSKSKVDVRVVEVRATPTPRDASSATAEVGNLLAVIHGDGGHYESEHGTQKAARDAIDVFYAKTASSATGEAVAIERYGYHPLAVVSLRPGTDPQYTDSFRITWLKAPHDGLKLYTSRMYDEFKNFHRLLCERFDYTHDADFWWRDQLSLIEHIAAQQQRQAQGELGKGANIEQG